MKCLIAPIALFLFVMSCGCGTSTPSDHSGSLPTEQDAEQFLRQTIAQDKKQVTLVTFHKTSSGNEDRGEQYFIGFEGDIESNATNAPSAAKKMQRRRISGKVYFQNTEQGWLPSGVWRDED